MNGKEATIHLDVDALWNWYWQDKAHVSPSAMPGFDQLAMFWNWLMVNDAVRMTALAFVSLWMILSLLDSLFTPVHASSAALAPRQQERAQEQPMKLSAAELKAALVRLARTQTELAEELGVSRAYVSQLVNGRKAFGTDLQKRCRKILNDWAG
jgi:hypothetical protein